jgi:hypothetical protein
MIAVINKLYRRLFCRGGHGVHSPFAFDLITTVIEDNCGYYCYDSLGTVRKQLLFDESKIRYKNCEYTVKQYLDKHCFSESEDRLLFRLANRFRPRTILMTGSDLALAPLYLTAYSKDARCIVIEKEKDVAVVSRKYIEKYSSSIELVCSGDFVNSNIDFIVLGNGSSDFETSLELINDETVLVIADINASKVSRKNWKLICNHPRVTVTFDLYSLGIVFFNPKLHRKSYKS